MITFTREQITPAFEALPEKIQDILFTLTIEHKVQKVGFGAGLLIDQIKSLNTIVNFAIMNLVPREDISSVIEKELSIPEKVAQEVASEVKREIFATIEAMESQAQKEQARYEENTGAQTENAPSRETQEPQNVRPIPAPPSRIPEKTADVAPDNLPTEEVAESFLPNLAPKTVTQAPVSHDETPLFEQKMKKVFTGSTNQNTEDLSLTTPQAQAPQNTPTPTPHIDPYREPIE